MPLMIEEVGLASDGVPVIRLIGSKDDAKRVARLFGDEVVIVPAETIRGWVNEAADLQGGLASSIGQYVPPAETDSD